MRMLEHIYEVVPKDVLILYHSKVHPASVHTTGGVFHVPCGMIHIEYIDAVRNSQLNKDIHLALFFV